MSEEVPDLTIDDPGRRKAEFELEQAALQREYDEMMKQGMKPQYKKSPTDEEVEELRAMGYDIPDTTPQEPPVFVEHQPLGDNEGGAAPIGRQGRVRTIERPNPNYVSPAMRAKAIEQARKAAQAQNSSPNIAPQTFTPPSPQQMNPAQTLQYANYIQQCVGTNLTVVGCSVQNG